METLALLQHVGLLCPLEVSLTQHCPYNWNIWVRSLPNSLAAKSCPHSALDAVHPPSIASGRCRLMTLTYFNAGERKKRNGKNFIFLMLTRVCIYIQEYEFNLLCFFPTDLGFSIRNIKFNLKPWERMWFYVLVLFKMNEAASSHFSNNIF